ncbi:MAG: EVE domain-containing protein, partial [Planctomycetota bacterium]
EKRTCWDGIGNNTALMHLRAMKKGDEVLIYESGKGKAVVGTATIVKGPYPEPNRDDPKYVVVDIRAGKALKNPVTLADIKADGSFTEFPLVRISRLSVMPVTAAEWKRLMKMSNS